MSAVDKSEKKRKRAIARAQKLFRTIDFIYDRAQNACPYLSKQDIENIYCKRDIVYDESLPDVCKLDYYRKPSDTIVPAIILIHGGGFTAGDKKYRRGQAQWLAMNGFAVFNINYGLAPDYIFPKPLEHVAAAGDYILANAERYRIDVEKIIVCGDSAGAYLGAMIGALSSNEDLRATLEIVPKFKVFATLLNCGIYDMDTVIKAKIPFGILDWVVTSFTGAHANELPNYKYRDCCMAADFVTPEFPQTFLIYSDSDIFCKGHSDVFLAKLKESGVRHSSYKAKHRLSNHCYSLTWRSRDAKVANARMLAFAKYIAFGEKQSKLI